MLKRVYSAIVLAIAALGIVTTANATPGDYREIFAHSTPSNHRLILNTDAGNITLYATSGGNYDNFGKHDLGFQYGGHYFAEERHTPSYISIFRNYFVFEILDSLVAGRTIYGAKLSIDNPSNGSFPSNMNPAETLSIFDVKTDFNLLAQQYAATWYSPNPAGIAIYNDLGDGALFGQRTVSAIDSGTQVEIELNESALAAITAALGKRIGFGGSIDARNAPVGPFLGAQIYADTAGYAGSFNIEYSDDASNWNIARSGFVPGQAGWNATSWPDVGAHRYWRLSLENIPGPGPWLNELQMHIAANLASNELGHADLSGFNASAIVDGNTACCGWHTDSAPAGAQLRINVGNLRGVAFLGADIYASAAGYSGSYSMQYSDDGDSWLTARTGIVPNQQGWNRTTWPDVGRHRFWRLLLENTPGPGGWLNELRLHVHSPRLRSAMFSQSGLSGYAPDAIIDGNTTTYGWRTNNAGAAWLRVDTGDAVDIDGAAKGVSLNPSQTGRHTFTGVAGQRLGIGVTGLTMNPSPNGGALSVKLYKPDGSLMNSFSAAGAIGGGVLNLGPLPATGAYALVTNPGPRAAEFSLLLSTAVTDNLIVNAVPFTFSTTRVGQFARYSFSGIAGQSYTVEFTGNTFPGGADVFINKPDGTMLKPKSVISGTANHVESLATLPVTGVYFVLVRPGAVIGQTNQISVKLVQP